MYGGKTPGKSGGERICILFNAQPAVCAEYFDIKKIAEIKKYFLSSMRLRGSCRARNKFSQTLINGEIKKENFGAADFFTRQILNRTQKLK